MHAMRFPVLAVLCAFGIAACDAPEPPGPSTAPAPPKPVALAPQPAPQAAPPAAPVPSADELLRARVAQALRDTREVDGQGVDVTVAGGAVSLFGTVPAEAERRRVAQFVARIEGVKSVVNKLVVVRGS
jgi:hypothetical protein